MAKKIVVILQVSPAVLALRGLSLGLDQHTPSLPPWTALASTVHTLARQAASGCRQALRAIATLRGRRGLRLRPLAVGEPRSLRRLELQLDVPTLLAQPRGPATLQRLHTLLESFAQAGWWQIEAHIGSRTRASSLLPVLAELTAQAAALDVVLTSVLPARSATQTARARATPPPPARPPVPRVSPTRTPSRTRAEAPAPGPLRPAPTPRRSPPQEEKKPKAKPKKPRPPVGGSFGGLPDDEVSTPPGAPGPDRSDEASFFLSYGRLSWPCTEAELRHLHRQIVKTLHPDRCPDDPGASHRFMLLQRGYEALRAQLNG